MNRFVAMGILGFGIFQPAAAFEVGVSAIEITPDSYELRPLPSRQNKRYFPGDRFWDTGTDGLFDFEEPGALGPDLRPGVADRDDDNDRILDNCDRTKCTEFLASGSDDLPDRNNDNASRGGNEGDGKFQFLHLGGFSPIYPRQFGNRYATGVHDPIWARALAFRDSNGTPLVLVSVDLPSLGWKISNPVRRKVAAELGIPVSNIVIANTHAHSGPDACGYFVTLLKRHNKKYTDILKTKLAQAIGDAVGSLRPAKMKTITTTHVSCYDPRTMELKKDPHCRMPAIRKDMLKDDGTRYDRWLIQADKRDPIVRNTRIVAALFSELGTDVPIATFINWSNHPDTAGGDNMEVSSDYAHYLRAYMEAKLGGKAVFFTGTLGSQIGPSPTAGALLWSDSMERQFDASGKPILVTHGWDVIRSIGFEVASEAVSALQGVGWDALEPVVEIKTESLDSPIDNFLHVIATGSVWKFDVAPEDKMIHTRRGRCSNFRGCVRSDLSVIRIGELGLVTAPGEVDPAYFLGRSESKARYSTLFGRNWKFPAMTGWDSYMPGRHHAVLGQAHNYLSYLLHARDNHGWWNYFHPNYYEEFVTVSSTLGDDVGNKIMQMLGSSARFSKNPVPSPIASKNLAEESAGNTSSEADDDSSSVPEGLLFWLLGKIAKPAR